MPKYRPVIFQYQKKFDKFYCCMWEMRALKAISSTLRGLPHQVIADRMLK